MEEGIVPELGKRAFKTARKIVKGGDEADKFAEMLASGSEGVFWSRGLKPYIEARIERLKRMTEVNLDGGESLEEVGTRFLICSSIAQELQGIIDRVEATAGLIRERREKKKRVKK